MERDSAPTLRRIVVAIRQEWNEELTVPFKAVLLLSVGSAWFGLLVGWYLR